MYEFEFDNKNILQADKGVDSLERGAVEFLSIRCPHCLHVGVFPSLTTGLQWEKISTKHNKLEYFIACIRLCPNPKCKGIICTISSRRETVRVFPPELIDFEADGIPAKLVSTFEEAISCHAAGAYRASAMMVRRLLEEICDESGASGRTLHDKLIALKSKIVLPEELFDAMGELKALGNDAAHITAKDYAQIGKDEVEDSIELAKEILKARYQLKGLVERLRARKSNGKSEQS